MNVRQFMTTMFLSMLGATSHADTVYVRDTLYVPLRGGQTNEHRILHRGLKSGTALERLEVNEDTGYTRVRTEGGLEGWLQTQYLVDEPIAGTRLEQTLGQLEQLEASHQQTLLRLREATEAGDATSQATEALQAKFDALNAEYEALVAMSENVVSIEQENQELSVEINELDRRLNEIRAENEALDNDHTQQWFLYGAGTVLLGLLFGFLFGRRIYYRRHNSGWA